MFRSMLALTASALFLTGCQTTQPVVTAAGPAGGAQNKAIDFIGAAANARVDPKQTRSMLDRGFELIKSNCDDYFRSAGDRQFELNFIKDTVATGATVLTSSMLYNPRNKKIVGVIPLVGGATYAGVDVYNRNFLFNAENIDAVKTLVLRAIAEHQRATLRDLGENQPTYGEVLFLLQDDQAYCTPTKIVPLVRAAIKKGDVQVVSPSTPPIADARTPEQIAADDAVLKALGTELNPPAALSLEQTTALYWLFEADNTTSERLQIREKLKGLPSSSIPLDEKGVPPTGGWSHQAKVEELLRKLSGPTVARMRTTISQFQSALTAKEQAVVRIAELRGGGTAASTGDRARLAAEAAKDLPSLDPAKLSGFGARQPVVVDIR